MNRQSLVAKMLHLQVASALVCILLYFALLFATRAGLSYYNKPLRYSAALHCPAGGTISEIRYSTGDLRKRHPGH